MRLKHKIFLLLVLLNCIFTAQSKCDKHYGSYNPAIVIQQVKFDPNNTETWIYNTVFQYRFKIRKHSRFPMAKRYE